ncbi:MAG: carbohydrate kinase family protein [Rhodobacteraceae bacterium]|nr:carbohydrate kinase family protein [Paracoccaceae bacterium]MCY4140047.1 carbohydrate kinase family protein [Paracoccaceae bacterium]
MTGLDVFSVGAWALFDYILRADHYPEEGETVELKMPSKLLHTRFFGDCSANLAASAAATGVNVGLGMVVGDDFNRYGYRAHLLELGVDLSGVDVRSDADSGYNFNISDNRGRGMCFSHLGVAADQNDWAPPLQQIENSRVVAVSEKFSSYTLASIRHARERGKTTVINGMVGTANQEAMKFLQAADYLFISEKECKALLRVLDMSSAKDLLKAGLSTLVVTRGSEGSRWITGEGEFHCDAVPCARIQDTTGAGDCFAGTAIGLIAQGASLQEAARIAAAAASYVVEKWGCQTNLVGRERAERRAKIYFEKGA